MHCFFSLSQKAMQAKLSRFLERHCTFAPLLQTRRFRAGSFLKITEPTALLKGLRGDAFFAADAICIRRTYQLVVIAPASYLLVNTRVMDNQHAIPLLDP
jgi:hypothetical protein